MNTINCIFLGKVQIRDATCGNSRCSPLRVSAELAHTFGGEKFDACVNFIVPNY